MVNNKLGILKEGEEYSFVDDMKDAYRKSLSKSLATQIFETIPDHVFYDIKAPLKSTTSYNMNPFNPARPKNAYTFFEHRRTWEYLDEKHRYSNVKTSISRHKRY